MEEQERTARHTPVSKDGGGDDDAPPLHPAFDQWSHKLSMPTEETTAAQQEDEFAVLVPLLQRARPQRPPPPSFALAPPIPLPLWQRVTLSALNARHASMQTQRKFKHVRQNVSRELTRYHVELQERAERQRQQQRESRARAGEKVAAAVQRLWSRRGDAYQQLMKVEFDVVKHQRDRQKQEDLLRETEALTRKLLESFFKASSRTGAASPSIKEDGEHGKGGAATHAAAAASTPVAKDEDAAVNVDGLGVGRRKAARPPNAGATLNDTSISDGGRNSSGDGKSFWAKVGDDDDAPIEDALSLLDTEHGKRPLRHYQRSSLRWMVHLYENNLNGILADEMGLGKTVQTIALLCYFAEYRNDWGPHLVVVPTTVVLNWKAELDRWAPGLKVLTYIGSAKERHQLRKGWTSEDAFHICVTSYNLIVQDRKVFRRRPWGFLVLDEAHQVKNFMSIKWQSLFDLQAEYRLLLTGTPLQNSIMELWSLFHFLLPFASAFRSNAEFKEWFSNPMDAMISGRSALNEDIVRRLQALIRPFMLRRLKKDVESQLPTKTEKVVLCHLSRRQRFLYDDYMQLADTRQKLRGGGAGGVLSVLLALRKVCDHPDLFEERPTVSPFVLGYEALVEQLVPRAVLLNGNATLVTGRSRFPSFYVDDVNADRTSSRRYEALLDVGEHGSVLGEGERSWAPAELDSPSCLLFSSPSCAESCATSSMPWWAAQLLVDLPNVSTAQEVDDFAERYNPSRILRWKGKALEPFAMREKEDVVVSDSGAADVQRCDASTLQAAFLAALRTSVHTAACRARHTAAAQQQRYLAMQCARNVHVAEPCKLDLCQTRLARNFPALCPTIADRVAALYPIVEKVCVYVPAVLAPRAPRLRWLLPIAHTTPFKELDRTACAALIGDVMKRQDAYLCGREPPRQTYDGACFLHELWQIQVRRSFSFPDKRLLIHDCGKLQFLEAALKEMRQEGHRALIFTQFVQMLNILERFLALIGVTYLRLDGATKAELRQQLVDRFNADARITCMILSTRSGGVGLNLTGADTVVFYDSDWNPTMDLQAQDRCHRIGQTRPVTIYRLISEHTVEESILQKARERKKLNNVVIRGGQFHTIADVGEQYDDSAAAFAALSDPVNLRSFFHDLDEDATVEAEAVADLASSVSPSAKAGVSASGSFSMLAEMANVEDEEDRVAGQEFQREIAEWEAQEAAGDAGDIDDDGDRDNGVGVERKRARQDFTGVEHAATSEITAAAWQRKGANTLRDAYLLPRGAAPHAYPARTDENAVEAVAGAAASTAVSAAMVRLAVRKRQRELLRKATLPVDQLLTLQYGRCQRDDAEERYDSLVETYTAQMNELSSQDDEDDDEDMADVRLPRFCAVYRLGAA